MQKVLIKALSLEDHSRPGYRTFARQLLKLNQPAVLLRPAHQTSRTNCAH